MSGPGDFAQAQAGQARPQTPAVSRFRIFGIRELGIFSALMLICIALTIASPYFLVASNLLNVSRQMASIAIMAVGMTYLIISRDFDLSVGSTYGLVGIIAGMLVLNLGLDIWVAVPIVLVFGMLVGLFNGTLVAIIGIPSFIVTLGSLSILRGAALILSGGRPVSDLPPSNFLMYSAASSTASRYRPCGWC